MSRSPALSYCVVAGWPFAPVLASTEVLLRVAMPLVYVEPLTLALALARTSLPMLLLTPVRTPTSTPRLTCAWAENVSMAVTATAAGMERMENLFMGSFLSLCTTKTRLKASLQRTLVKRTIAKARSNELDEQDQGDSNLAMSPCRAYRLGALHGVGRYPLQNLH